MHTGTFTKEHIEVRQHSLWSRHCKFRVLCRPARCSGDIGQVYVPVQDGLYEGSIAALNVQHIQLDGSCNVAKPFQQVSLCIADLKLLTVRQALFNSAQG